MASPARVLDEIGALDLTPEIRAELLDCIDAAQEADRKILAVRPERAAGDAAGSALRAAQGRPPAAAVQQVGTTTSA